jgi:hypothetical protein
MDPGQLEFAKDLDRSSGIDPLPPDWYYFPVVEIMTAGDVIGVESWPGFSDDLTSWKLWVSEGGVLSVVASVCKPYEGIDGRYEFRQARIGHREARRLVQFAERLGFADFAERYDCDITDLPLERVAVRLGGRLKCVECYGRHPPGLWVLWRRVHRYAPLVSRYLPWWARGWRGRLFGWCGERAEQSAATDRGRDYGQRR